MNHASFFAGALAALAVGLTACSGPPPIQSCEGGDGLTPICGFTNPEDLVGLPGGWLIVSEMAFRDGIDHADVDALVDAARASNDAKEGIAARLEKRAPRFTGE